MLLEIVPAEPGHAPYLADHMRLSDQVEIWLSHRSLPAEALQEGLLWPAWTALLDGRPEVMFGMGKRTLLGSVGVPWLLGTERMHEIPIRFIRESRRRIGPMSQGLSLLENYVHVENDLSVRWLRWLGFEFDEPKPYGVEGELFVRFYKHV